jgi:hypothetical protein
MVEEMERDYAFPVKLSAIHNCFIYRTKKLNFENVRAVLAELEEQEKVKVARLPTGGATVAMTWEMYIAIAQSPTNSLFEYLQKFESFLRGGK